MDTAIYPRRTLTLPDPWFRPSRMRHVIIADVLRALIESGEIEAKLPDIPSLRREYGCTAKTALRALRVLELEKLIYLIIGQGYYVANPEGA